MSLSQIDAKKCEKDFLKVDIDCASGAWAENTQIVAHTVTYDYTDPKNGKRKEVFTPAINSSATICMGSDRNYIGMRIKADACDAKDITATVRYCKLSKAEVAAAPKEHPVQLCKKLKKDFYTIVPLGYEFDANKDGKNRIEFNEQGMRMVPK